MQNGHHLSAPKKVRLIYLPSPLCHSTPKPGKYIYFFTSAFLPIKKEKAIDTDLNENSQINFYPELTKHIHNEI